MAHGGVAGQAVNGWLAGIRYPLIRFAEGNLLTTFRRFLDCDLQSVVLAGWPRLHLARYCPHPSTGSGHRLAGFNPLWKVADPACGDGAFLKEALRRGANAVAGVDIDPEAIESARENLQEFESRSRLFCQDGLTEIESENGFWKEHYDLVIGNSPFASSKWRVRDEVLFLERFIQLARPGGRIAIILPEGVFANSNLRYVREWLIDNFTIYAVVGLPRDTFKEMGTSAKTAVLYLEKRKPPAGHQTILAEVEELDLNGRPNPRLQQVVTAVHEHQPQLAQQSLLGL